LDPPTTSDLFTILWDALVALLGTAATATLLKRAARRAVARSPELAELIIRRQGLVYYTCPIGWSGRSAGRLATSPDAGRRRLRRAETRRTLQAPIPSAPRDRLSSEGARG